MVNLELLNKLIDESGLKRSYIANCLGISKQAFWKKTTGYTDWSISQISVLQKILGFSDNDLLVIFFAKG